MNKNNKGTLACSDSCWTTLALYVTNPTLQEVFDLIANFFLCSSLFFPPRATISVSWVHQRQRMLTGCFVVSWEPFTYSVKLSTQLRSLPFTNLAQGTRWGNVLPYQPLYCIFPIRFRHQCLAGQNILATWWLHLQCYLILSLPVHIVSQEVVDAISLWAVSCKNSLCVGARVSLRLWLRFCRQLMYRLRTMQGLLYTALMQEHESSVLLHKKHMIEVMLVPPGVAEARLFKHLSITLSISTI